MVPKCISEPMHGPEILLDLQTMLWDIIDILLLYSLNLTDVCL